MKVQEILSDKSSTVITVAPDQTILEAAKMLAEHNIGSLVVINENGLPVGILSERDIVRRIAEAGTDAITRKVSDVMTKDVIIALPEDEITYLSNTMTSKRIRHLPVMDNETLVGIVSIGDIVKAQMDHFEGEALTLQRHIAGLENDWDSRVRNTFDIER